MAIRITIERRQRRVRCWLRMQHSNSAFSSERIEQSSSFLLALADAGRPGWSDKARRRGARERHPLVRRIAMARTAVANGTLAKSHSGLWVVRFATDLEQTLPLLQRARTAARLRDPSDCEALKYECLVLARYLRSGLDCRVTDTGGAGEFVVQPGNRHVAVECKRKVEMTAAETRVENALGELANAARSRIPDGWLLVLESVAAPRASDAAKVAAAIADSIAEGLTGPREGRVGRYRFAVACSTPPAGLPSDAVWMPAGYEGRVSGRRRADGTTEQIGGVIWRTLCPGDWRRTAMTSVKRANDQLPKDGPGIVWLSVPDGEPAEVANRVVSMADTAKELLPEHSRVSALVITGTLRTLEPSGEARVGTVSDVVLNSGARFPLEVVEMLTLLEHWVSSTRQARPATPSGSLRVDAFAIGNAVARALPNRSDPGVTVTTDRMPTALRDPILVLCLVGPPDSTHRIAFELRDSGGTATVRSTVFDMALNSRGTLRRLIRLPSLPFRDPVPHALVALHDEREIGRIAIAVQVVGPPSDVATRSARLQSGSEGTDSASLI